MDFLVIFLTSLGLGIFFSMPKNNFFELPGIYLFTGFASLPIFIFWGESFFSKQLANICLIFFLITLTICLVFIFQNRKNLSEFINHPVWILSIIGFLTYTILPLEYNIHAWDEYSHWLLMPKQIFLGNTLVPLKPLMPHFSTYTPGWPTLITYPLFILRETFTEANAFIVGGVGGIFIVSFFYDVFIFNKKNSYPISYVLFTIFLLAVLKSIGSIFPSDLLVENPLTQIIIATFATLYMIEKDKRFFAQGVILITIFLTSGYMIKEPFIAVTPIIILAFAFLPDISKRKKILAIISITSLWILTALMWKYRTSIFTSTWSYSKAQDFESIQSLIFSKNSSLIILAMLEEGFELVIKKLHIFPFIYLAFKYVRQTHSGKVALYSFVAYFALYLVGLYWTYLVAFSNYEALKIASFKRYFYVAWKPFIGISIIFASKFIWEKYSHKLSFFSKSLSTKVVYSFYMILLIVCFVKVVKIPESSIKLAINEIPHNTSDVLFISQKDRGVRILEFKFHLLREAESFPLVKGYSYSERPSSSDLWTSKISSSEMNTLIQKTSLIIVWDSDEWINGVLNNVCDTSKKLKTRYFLVKKSSQKFDCKAFSFSKQAL